MVNSINTNTSTTANVKTTGVSAPSSSSAISKSSSGQPVATAETGTGSQFSSLALQLSESAARAQARDTSLSREELGAKARELTNQIIGSSYDANKSRHDAEVPDTDNPDLLARAKSATQFVNGSGTNPFAGLSREQLSLIAYDDSGAFTVNEKRAAWIEDFNQESQWRQQFAARAMAEYNETGKLTNAFTEALEHFEGLPAIEQAQYPDDYATKLQEWIDLDFNYKTHTAEGKGSTQDILDKVLNLDSSVFDEDSSTPEA